MNNLEMMKKRFEWQGGIRQEDRMIKDKWRTLQRALKYSYQACTVQKSQNFDELIPVDCGCHEVFESTYPHYRALINPDKVKQDYDDKILSIDYDTGYQPGDVFEWKKTGTHWIIYTQEITEDAYFRGEIRRCRHQIKFKDEDGNIWITWAAIRGPVETQIDSIQKNQERIDVPNLSLNILLPRNEKTLKAFDRYSEFLFAGRCWRVEAPDSISMKNIIEVNAEENYINDDTDDIKNEIKNGLVISPIDPTPCSEINGETFIKPKLEYSYSIDKYGGCWKILENVPVKFSLSTDKSVKLTWNKMVSGQFTLVWTKDKERTEKIIVVESLY